MGRFRWHRVRTVVRGSTSTIRVKPLRYEEEYTKVAEYPPILDTSYKERMRRKFIQWHEDVKSLNTVEEKLMKINMPKYYGWQSSILKEGIIDYNMLPLVQHITRTHLLEFNDLPKSHSENEVNEVLKDESYIVKLIKIRRLEWARHILRAIENINMQPLKKALCQSVSWMMIWENLLSSNSTESYWQTCQTNIETNPRVETFWLAGFENPPKNYLKGKDPWFKELAEEIPFNRWFQYFGSPVLHIRHELPLPAIGNQQLENIDYKIPNFQCDPKVVGVRCERRVGTNIPGFWPGDPCEFGLLSYHNRGYLLNRPKSFGSEDNAEALKVQAVLASFGWLHPQACYQGFSTYNDVTYPLVTQTVITNGKLWSFYVYQLNTTLIHSENAFNNPSYNLCWSTPELKLFEEITDGKVVGFNDEVLKNLIMFYINSPKARDGVELKPYLGKEEKHIANINDDKRRVWLENAFKHMYSGRPRHRTLPEIYDWEKIYKIRHKTRPHEARKRPFELRIDPYKRRYDEHVPKYIPKKLRDEDKPKKKFEDTYYP
ncbi:hypothetical protein C0J52_19119 [Blattella germanica]|nr:hypothetical protein C0J52_19119 [Blattella germanica]